MIKWTMSLLDVSVRGDQGESVIGAKLATARQAKYRKPLRQLLITRSLLDPITLSSLVLV